MAPRHPRGRGGEADRQRLHRADRQGAPDGVRRRDEPADRAADGGLHWLRPRRSSCRPSRGAPGWEFTELGDFTLEAWEPAPADGTGLRGRAPARAARRRGRARAGRRRVRRGRRPSRTARSCCRCRSRASAIPSWSSRTSARSSATSTPSPRPTTPTGRAARSSGSRAASRVEAPILLTAVTAAPGTILNRRVLIVLEEGAEAEVWEQYVSGGDEATVLNTVVELRVGQNANLRYVCGQELNERSWIFGAQRAEVARDGALDWVALGFGSAQRQGAHGDAARRPGRRREGHRRVRAARPPARRLRHDAGARRAEHDVRPRVPRHPRRPLERGLARDDQGRPGRAADRRVPGVPQPAALQAGARGRDPGPRDPRQRRPLHARGGGRPDRQGAALLPALARARPARPRRGS